MSTLVGLEPDPPQQSETTRTHRTIFDNDTIGTQSSDYETEPDLVSPPPESTVKVPPKSDIASEEEPSVQSSNSDDDDEAELNFAKRYHLKWLVALLLIALILMVPGIIGVVYFPDLQLGNVAFFNWSLMFCILFAAMPAAFLVVRALLVFLNHFYVFKKHVWIIAYHCRHSFYFLFWSVGVFVAWEVVVYQPQLRSSMVPSYNFWYVTSTFGSLMALAIAFVIKDVLVAIFSEQFQEKLYLKRVHDAAFADYAVSILVKQASKKSRPRSLSPSVHSTASDVERAAREPLSELTTQQFMSMIHSIKRRRLASYTASWTQSAASSRRKALEQANLIFQALKNPSRDELLHEDFTFVRMDVATGIFRLFDPFHTGRITRDQMRNKMKEIVKERKLLTKSLHDTRSVVGKLGKLMTALTLVIMFFVCLAIFGVDVQAFVISFSAIIVAYSFLFGSALSALFQSALFLFVVHPFDIGDRVFINGNSLIVHEVSYISTVFYQWDGQRIYYPNSVLLSTPITNIRRSRTMVDSLVFAIDLTTPAAYLLEFERQYRAFLAENSDLFDPAGDLLYTGVSAANQLQLTLYVRGYDNWQDSGPRWARRSKVLIFVKNLMDTVGIHYAQPTQPVRILHEAQSAVADIE